MVKFLKDISPLLENNMKLLRILILFLTFPALSWAQNPASDCSGAIKICGDGRISSNADGIGTQELNGTNNCASQETNSLWLEIEITKAGSLGFNLKPTSNDINVDYDFFIFGPNASCNNLGNAIRCSTTNPNAAGLASNFTGLNARSTETSEGPGPDGDSFVANLDVEPGETYFIVIDRPVGNSPFELEWTGTATTGGFPFPDGPQYNEGMDLETCNANGSAIFDLSQNTPIINIQNNTTLTYHETIADATDGINALSDIYTSDVPSKPIFARIENDLTGCSKITDFTLTINDGPLVAQNLEFMQCDLDKNNLADYELSDLYNEILSGINGAHDIAFFTSENAARENSNPVSSLYNSAGAESLFARTSEAGNPDCFNITRIELILNEPPNVEAISLVQPAINSNSNTIEISFPNTEAYEYSIGNEDGPFQTSTTFENVTSGFQDLYIRDLNQCAIIKTQIAIIGYDNFFTPNEDGINDFWQLNGISSETAAANQISIFDRYGKLLTKLTAADKGWDGTFDGQPMPADDYWFRVLLQTGQEFKGHFSLVR